MHVAYLVAELWVFYCKILLVKLKIGQNRQNGKISIFKIFIFTEVANWLTWKRFSDLSRFIRIYLIFYSILLAQLFHFQTCKVLPFFNFRQRRKIVKNRIFKKIITFLFLKLESWFWYQITQNDEHNPMIITNFTFKWYKKKVVWST